jgi:hypothetical protein
MGRKPILEMRPCPVALRAAGVIMVKVEAGALPLPFALPGYERKAAIAAPVRPAVAGSYALAAAERNRDRL